MERPQVDHIPGQDLSAEDQAMFDRVWQRVMADRESALPPPPPAPEPLPVPMHSCGDSGDCGCPGSGAAEYVPRLREMAVGMADLLQLTQTLVRRTQGSAARALRTLAGDQHQALRQLSTMYFLLTGEHPRHIPAGLTPPTPVDLQLRELYLGEQRWYLLFSGAAQDCRDGCLRPMFSDHARRARSRMVAVRRVLENL